MHGATIKIKVHVFLLLNFIEMSQFIKASKSYQ